MTAKTTALLAAALAICASPLTAQTAAPSVESRLRDQIKTTNARAATAEAALAALQVEKAAVDAKAAGLEKQVKEVGSELASERLVAAAAAKKNAADIMAKEQEITDTRAKLAKATEFGTNASEMWKKTETERDRLRAEAIGLKDVVANQRTKNAAMFEISNEILTRYSKFGLGTALTAREPFVGITRARLETMVEEYGGKIAAQRLKTVGDTPSAGTPPAQPRAEAKPSAPKTNRPKD